MSRPDLGPDCLQSLPADETSRQRVKKYIQIAVTVENNGDN